MRYIYNCGVSLSVCVGRALRIILDWDRGIEELHFPSCGGAMRVRVRVFLAAVLDAFIIF